MRYFSEENQPVTNVGQYSQLVTNPNVLGVHLGDVDFANINITIGIGHAQLDSFCRQRIVVSV